MKRKGRNQAQDNIVIPYKVSRNIPLDGWWTIVGDEIKKRLWQFFPPNNHQIILSWILFSALGHQHPPFECFISTPTLEEGKNKVASIFLILFLLLFHHKTKYSSLFSCFLNSLFDALPYYSFCDFLQENKDSFPGAIPIFL